MPTLGVGAVDPLGAQVGHGGANVIHFQADVPVTLFLGARGEMALKDLDERACPGLQVDAEAHTGVVPELEGDLKSQLAAVKFYGAIQAGNGEADMCQSEDHDVFLRRFRRSRPD